MAGDGDARPETAGAPADSELVETRIGSGSDHTVFLESSRPAGDQPGFTGDYGVYHSAYDDHYWMTHIGDPTFAYHTALTRIWGLVTLRLANADILPFDFAANGAALAGFLAELQHANKIDPARLSLMRLKDRIGDFEQRRRAAARGDH